MPNLAVFCIPDATSGTAVYADQARDGARGVWLDRHIFQSHLSCMGYISHTRPMGLEVYADQARPPLAPSLAVLKAVRHGSPMGRRVWDMDDKAHGRSVGR